MTSCKTYQRFNDIPHGEWDKLLDNDDFFLSEDFLSIIELSHLNQIIPLYTIIKEDDDVIGIAYSQVFNFQNTKLKNYIPTQKFNFINWLKSQTGKLLNIKVTFLGNLFLSNEPAFKLISESLTKQNLDLILQNIQESSGTKFLLIPEHYDGLLNLNSPKIKQIVVEPDMSLKISKQWNSFNDYLNDINSKYKKRYLSVRNSSKTINMKIIDSQGLKSRSRELKELYEQVYQKAKFNSSRFNTDVYQKLCEKNENILIYGYFKQNILVGFSSIIKNKNVLYAHFVGLDYHVNNSQDLYARMLYDKIEYAIENKLSRVKFGRTACEFKSNFGAKPHSNKGFIYDNTGRYLYLLKPFLDMLKPKKWTQRNPIKEVVN